MRCIAACVKLSIPCLGTHLLLESEIILGLLVISSSFISSTSGTFSGTIDFGGGIIDFNIFLILKINEFNAYLDTDLYVQVVFSLNILNVLLLHLHNI